MDTKEISEPGECPVGVFIQVVGGKWKIPILCVLRSGTLRFSALKRSLPGITQKMLTSQLRELEAHGMVNRVVYPVVPPKVEYSISDYGMTVVPLLDQVEKWGVAHLQQQ